MLNVPTLQDAALMYLLLTPSTPQHAGTVVKLAEKVKRKRYKASGEEIKLFVDDGSDGEGSSETTKKGKKKGDCEFPLAFSTSFLVRSLTVER